MIQMGVAAIAAAMTLSGGGLPQGMLFMESHPPAKQWESYKTYESKRFPLQLNPCFRDKAWDRGRVAGRAMQYNSEEEGRYEQLVIYRDVEHAKQAVRGLRAELKKCADQGKGTERYRYFTKPTDVGDEAVRAGGRFFHSGEHALAVRRGAAVYIVGQSAWPTRSLPIRHFRGLIDQAERMIVKVCELPESKCD
ncbi:hypothetical protein HII36_29985 [Nonomuraea sp. NN258]|uniref:hypothetical protein n=1 Tax=Nonomuraea antri TaxID=2730852 RepID=UPI0015693FE9|nr:hypothetical protein [Nonomuraea antri]NRQ36032.1 hypothetical protein [Nonomuraea antri]